MRVHIIELDADDDRLVDELVALKNDVVRADAPDRPVPNPHAFRNGLRRTVPWSTNERWIAMVDERVVGYLDVGLPLSANTHIVDIELLVHPGYRRQRIGSELMQCAYRVAARHGRRTAEAATQITWKDGPERPVAGELFLQNEGFTSALTEVVQTLDLSAVDRDDEQRVSDEAERASGEYRVVSFTERVPEDLIEGVAALSSIFLEQAPLGELEFERDPITAERIRTSNASSIEDGTFMLGSVALDPAGRVVAVSQIDVPAHPGDWADQEITLVHPHHRGHRLGTRLKVLNHRQLRELCPNVHTVQTGNASVNEHMIGINARLGFRPLDAFRAYQRQL